MTFGGGGGVLRVDLFDNKSRSQTGNEYHT
jgi:hypothetical protein